MNILLHAIPAIAFICTSRLEAGASVTPILDDFRRWDSLAGEVTTIDFTGYPSFTIITTQYRDMGVIFVDGNDHIVNPGLGSLPQDGSGLDGGQSSIYLTFAFTHTSFATHFTGGVAYRLFHRGSLLYESDAFGVGPGSFVGLVSDQPFDAIEIIDWFDGTPRIDNLYFGPPVVHGDLDTDGDVDGIDLGILLGSWSIPPGAPPCDGKKGPCAADLNHDGLVNGLDLGVLLDAWTF